MPTFHTPRLARWLLGGYVAAMLAVVFQPLPHAAVGSVNLGFRLVQKLGLDVVITPTMVEFVWNVALFVPLTFLGSVIDRRVTWEQWFGVGLAVSGTIEYVQLMFLPGRSASLLDLASNTLGGLLGALLALRLVRRREQPGPPSGSSDGPTVRLEKERQ
jgi:glycopeptide antibiotics resistance protein